MHRTVLPLLLVLSAGAHAEVTITGASPTDAAGNPLAPCLGEPFYVTVTLHAAGEAAIYRVTVDAPDRTIDSGPLSYQGDAWIRRGPFVPLFDGAMDVTVSCSAAKTPLRLRVSPTAPATAVETWDARRLGGTLSAAVRLDRPTKRLLAWVPLPGVPVESPARQGVVRETGAFVGLVEAAMTDRIEASASFETGARSVRTNLPLLREVPMRAVTGKEWLKPETRIQSGHKEIVAFARAATKGLAKDAPVADVALALYSAVLRRSVYASTGAAPDALACLRSGKGECGDLSALFVAACRAMGVPSRPVTGFGLGRDAWHVWAEFLVPSRGWVPVDPAYALGLRPRAASPLYFGVVPELRDRAIVGYGFDATVGAERTDFLQTPQVFTFEKGLRVRSAAFSCFLEPL